MSNTESRKNTWVTILIITTAFAVVGLTAFFGRAGFDLKARQDYLASVPTLSPGDVLLVKKTFTPVDFYNGSTGSLEQCNLVYGTQLFYLGSHGEYAVATVGAEYEGANPHKRDIACAKGAPVVVRNETAIDWRQNFIFNQERIAAEIQQKHEKVLAGQEILRDR